MPLAHMRGIPVFHTTPNPRRRTPAASYSASASMLESLEPRTLLSNPAPFPSLADFEDPTNPVLRLTTHLGEVDLELLANEVPDLITSYLAGLERGLTPDLTFFHRLLPGNILQGGLFGMVPEIGALPVNLPVENPVGSGRANTERTVATGLLLDSGTLLTSAFIFNLRDNTQTSDPDQSVVFARVIDDRSWDIVQMIASMDVADLTLDGSFGGFFLNSFHNVPVTEPYTPPGEDGTPGDPITEDLLAFSYDLALIKAPGAPDFYQHTLYEPEGFLHIGLREFVPIDNPNDVPVHYELIIRYEEGVFRDDPVVRGVIPANSRGGATINLGDWTRDSSIRYLNRPFAFELRSTLPLAATLSHYDLGSTIAAPFSPDLSTTWVFPSAVKADGVQDFLVWYNPGNEAATVTVTLIGDDGVALDPIEFQVDRFRRGGINFQTNADVPEGTYAVRITSTQPIIASRSHYALSGPPRDRPEGYSESGAPGDPSTRGIIPLAGDPGTTPATGDAPTISVFFYNPGTEAASVDISFYRPGVVDPAIHLPEALVVPAGGTATFEYSLPQGTEDVYSLSYLSPDPLHASYSFRRYEASYGGAVPTVAATEHRFAEGFTDPSRAAPNVLEDVLYIFNPVPLVRMAGAPLPDANVRINFRFTDGFEMGVDRVVAGGTMSRLGISTLDEIIEQATDHGRYFYSVEIISDLPVVAQMLHTDTSLGLIELRGGGFALSGAVPGTTDPLGVAFPRLTGFPPRPIFFPRDGT